MKTKILLLISLLIIVSGCGKKTPPKPWGSIVPKRIVNLEARPREGRLLLEWTAPKENTDNSALTDLVEFKILRSEGILVGDGCRGCSEKPEVVYTMKLESKGGEKGRRMSIFFDDQEARKVYVYQVVSINRRGYPSSPSNPVTVSWDYPPYPPRVVRGERGDKKVDLSWEPVEGATGYNIYRKGEAEEEEFSIQPLNRLPVNEAHYTDLNVENEKRYFYSVRAVRRVVKTDVEGKGSLGIPITPTDLISPNSPAGLVAIPLREGMELNWRRNQEPDLLGYYVYRRRQGETEFKRLNESPLVKETYLDTQVELGQDYEYAITAVDNSPRKNESPRSEEVGVKYLR